MSRVSADTRCGTIICTWRVRSIAPNTLADRSRIQEQDSCKKIGDDRAARRLAQDGHRKARLRHQRFQRRTDYPVGGLHPSRLHRSLGRKGEEVHLSLPSWRFCAYGKLLGGPPPRNMDRLETKIEDG